uniref:MFS domain-containing protein n=1 Tax=Rhabditophanes sp. KR3021 TaxID=114890 RepID=A0AC35TKX0_9BILA
MPTLNPPMPWKLTLFSILHGTIGNVGDLLSTTAVTFEGSIKSYFNGTEVIDFTINEVWPSNTYSVFTISSILGQIFMGILYYWVVNRYGVKNSWIKVRHFCVVAGCLIMLVARFTDSLEIAIFSQFVIGCSVFFSLPLLIHLSECAPFHKRASIILNTNTAYMTMTVLLLPLSATTELGNKQNWHIIYYIGIIFSLLYVFLTSRVIESPKQLYFTNPNYKKTEASILYYFGHTVNTEKVLDDYENELHMYKTRTHMSVKEMFERKSLRHLLYYVLVGDFTTRLSLTSIIFPYIQYILSYFEVIETNITTFMIGLQLIGLIASMLSATVSEIFPRRNLVLAFTFISAISFKLIFIAFLFKTLNYSLLITSTYVFISIFISFIVSNIGQCNIGSILITDMVPVHAKIAITQLISIVSNIVLLFITLTFIPLLQLTGSALFLNYNLIMMACAYFMLKKLPETKNKLVHEIFECYHEF